MSSNTSTPSANSSAILSDEVVFHSVTFSQADFEMQNGAQFWVPEDWNRNSITEKRAGTDPPGSVTPFSSSGQNQLC